MGPAPEGSLNMAAWNMIRDLVSADPALTGAAWDDLRENAGLLSGRGTEESMPRANAAGYLEF